MLLKGLLEKNVFNLDLKVNTVGVVRTSNRDSSRWTELHVGKLERQCLVCVEKPLTVESQPMILVIDLQQR